MSDPLIFWCVVIGATSVAVVIIITCVALNNPWSSSEINYPACKAGQAREKQKDVVLHYSGLVALGCKLTASQYEELHNNYEKLYNGEDLKPKGSPIIAFPPGAH